MCAYVPGPLFVHLILYDTPMKDLAGGIKLEKKERGGNVEGRRLSQLPTIVGL